MKNRTPSAGGHRRESLFVAWVGLNLRECAVNVLRYVAGSLFFALFAFPPSASAQRHPRPESQKLGEVTFPISCSGRVQSSFNRTVALLHSFMYSSAEDGFREIAQADPKCAMAHWGIAMSYYHELWEPPISPADLERGRLEIRRAQVLENGATPREQAFISALALFYRNAAHVPHAKRAMDYERAMASLAAKNPDDVESQLFYALALLSTASPSDRNRTNEKQAVRILEPLFERYPDHPGVAHYLIHACDSPELARRGLPAARAYAQIAPSAPHALHMPSHIFTLLGLWQDSILSNSAARTAAHQQGDVGEELHSMDYLMYAYLQAGRYAEARQLLHELQGMPNLPVDDFKVGYAASAMPARYAVERREWAEAAAIPVRPGSLPQVVAITYWSHAIGLARSGRPDAAEPEIENLNRSLIQVREKTDDYWAAQVEIQLGEAKAWTANAHGRRNQAVSLLRSAAEEEDAWAKRPITPGPIVPAREQLGDLLLQLGRPQEALHEFETSLVTAPGRRGSLSGAARAARMAGDNAKADRFEKVLQASMPAGSS